MSKLWRTFEADCSKSLGVMRGVIGGWPLIIADPPYNLGQDYEAYEDKKSREEYLAWSATWLKVAFNVSEAPGSLWVAIGDHFVSEIDVLAKGIGFHKRGHVIWYYTFGQNQAKGFARSHTHWLYYSSHRSDYTFNAADPAVRIPSERQRTYKDKRANSAGKLPDDTWIISPRQIPQAFGPVEDTWNFSRVCGTFKAKAKGVSPNQMPVAMLERIVLLCSNPGNTVVDMFMGTGTAGEAAIRHGRRYVGFDVSPKCVAYANGRLTNVDRQMAGTAVGQTPRLFPEPPFQSTTESV